MKDSIQEQLIVARRRQILETAARIFARKGFHPTTIKDIAREAGIAEGTIYNYFENKTALLIAILDLMMETARADADGSSLSEMDFRSFMKAYFTQPLMVPKKDDFELFRVIISEILVNKELRELYYLKILVPTLSMAEKYFEQWSERQLIKPVNIKLTIRVISGMVFGLILEHIMGDKILELEWDELPEFITNLIIEGIGSEKLWQ